MEMTIPLDVNIQSAGIPVRFGLCAGIFTPAKADAIQADNAVLFVSPWGLEDMCVRKFYRVIAEDLAMRGIASLRFDFPGTGDSLDPEGDQTLENWVETVLEAATELQTFSGVGHITLIGHGLGATLALKAADRLEQVSALGLLAPVTSGRMYLRETSIWWKLMAGDLGLGAEFTETGKVAIAGLDMSEGVAKDVEALKEATLSIKKPLPVLAVNRNRDGDTSLAARLEVEGSAVNKIEFRDYDALITNPMISRIPDGLADEIADWVRSVSPIEKAAHRGSETLPVTFSGDGFKETGLRFGPDLRLAGTLCTPEGEIKGSPVLLLGTSYDRASGWARSGVKTARYLADQGIASLRFDASGVGDSPKALDAPEQVLYSGTHDNDAALALHELQRHFGKPAIAAGRCSGGYHAFRTVLNESACAGAVSVNSYAFAWDDRQTVDEAIGNVARPLGDYSRRALNPETFRRILRGEVDLKAAFFNIFGRVYERLASRIAPFLGNFSATNRLKFKVLAAFEEIRKADKPVVIVYAENDPGQEQFKMTFGADAKGLRQFPNVTYVDLGFSDHNVTPVEAQDKVAVEIAKLALSTGKSA